MKITEPYSPTARANANAKPVSKAGIRLGRMTLTTMCQRLAPRLAAASSISASRSISTGWTVRTTKGMPMKIIATKMPTGVKATLMPSAASGAPSQPLLRKQRAQRNAGHRRRQSKWNIDDGVEQPTAGEAVAYQCPDNNRSHHQIDDCGGNDRLNEILSALRVRRLVTMAQN